MQDKIAIEMKKFIIIAAAIAAALSFTGCNKERIPEENIDPKTTVDHFEISISAEYPQDVLTFFNLTYTMSSNGRVISTGEIDLTKKALDLKEGIKDGEVINLSISAKAKPSFPLIGEEFESGGRHIEVTGYCVYKDGHAISAGYFDEESTSNKYIVENEEDKAEAIEVFESLNSFSRSFSIVKYENGYRFL